MIIIGTRLLIIVVLVFGSYFVRHSVRRQTNQIVAVAIVFGIASAVAALILNIVAQHVLHLKDPVDSTSQATTSEIIRSTAIFVVVEETVKFVPLALFLLRKNYFSMLSDGILYFGLAGLTFGSIEHVLYGLDYGQATLLIRIFSVLFLHAGLTGLVGYFYAKDRLLGNRFRTVVAFSLAVSLHYIYNLSLFIAARGGGTVRHHILLIMLSSGIAAGSNCLLVWLFYIASHRDWRRLQQPALGPVAPPHSL